MRYLKWIAPLTVLYVALTANVEPANWVLGGALAAGITALLRPDPAPVRWRNLPAALLAAAVYLVTLLWDLLVSSVEVGRLVLQREMPLRSGVVALEAGSKSPLVTTLSAQAITLTPGEIVLEMDDDGVLYVHSLDVTATAATEPVAQARRVRLLERIF